MKGVFWGVGGAASDAISRAGDSGVGAETARAAGNGLEELALAEVGAPLVPGRVRIVSRGERLVAGNGAGPATTRRRGGEGLMARRSRVVREAMGTGRGK